MMKSVSDPVLLTSDDGAYLIDIAGKRHLDFSTRHSVMALGFANKRVNESTVYMYSKRAFIPDKYAVGLYCCSMKALSFNPLV